METTIQEKLIAVLEFVLGKLSRYDEGNPIGAILSIAPSSMKPNSIFNKMKNLVDTPASTAASPAVSIL